jgi:tyrosyl-tRNA synthetase
VRRQIQGGGVRVNDRQVSDEKLVVGDADLTADGVVKL